MDAIKALRGGSKSKLGEGQLIIFVGCYWRWLKMCERLFSNSLNACVVCAMQNTLKESRVLIARECTGIYAPLANRLGIGQLKWELEDLYFRYLHPEAHKSIASLLEQKRTERERYMVNFVPSLDN